MMTMRDCPRLRRRAVLLGASALAMPALARAQSWPERPIRWIVNFPPGGAADILSRTLAEWFGTKLGQPIVVENRPGAGGMVGSDIVAKAKGDPHVVMMSNAASHGIGPVLYRAVPYDPVADFTHIHLVGTFSSVLCVNVDLPVRSFADYVAMAKANPGGVQYGSGGNGTMNHLIGQLFMRAAGIEIVHVPYRGSAPAMTDVMGGQIPSLMESLPTAMSNIRGGRLRPIATSEAERASTLPEVPTFAESGYPSVVSTNWFGFSAAAGIPPAVAERWRVAIAEALASDLVKERFASIGVRPGTLGPAEYTALVRSELDRWREVIRAGNISVD